MNKIYLIRSFVISLFLVFSYFIGDAQNSSGFKNLSVRDGLSQGWVQKIIQDHNGYMWFATNDGLNKYDGNKFTIYQHEPQDSLSLLSSFVTALCEDSIGNIWVGMNHGLGMYNYKTDQIEGIDLGGDYFVTNIFLNGNEELVISSFFGIFIYNFTDKNIERFLIEDQPVETFHNRFRVVTPFQSGLITFTDNGIFYFDYKTRTFSKYFDLPDGFKGGGVRSATIIDSALWIGYLDNGLAYIDLKFSNELKFETLDDLADNTIFAIIKYNNKLVIGTENNGLYYLESLGTGAKFQVTARVNNDASNPMGLSSNSVHSFCIDKQKNLWIGTYNGVSYTYGNVLDFRSITRQIGENSLVNSMVSSIVELDDMLWLGTEDGIDIFTKQGNKQGRLSFSEDANRNSLQGKAILAMEFDDAGNVWAGSWSGGIDVIDSERNIIKRYSTGETSQDLANETIMCIEKDAEGNMWIGTMGGGVNVFLKDKGIFKKHRFDIDDPSSITNEWIKAILVTSKNEIWVSTHSNLELYDAKLDGFHHFSYDKKNVKGIPADGIISMHEDSYGNIWFGTPSGLSRFVRSDSTFINYTTDNGLPNNTIQGILSDAEGNIWVSTNSGLSKVIYDAEQSKAIEFINYDIRDGIVGNEFIRRSVLQTSDQLLCFGSKEGLVIFHPERITFNDYVPPVLIDKLLVNNRSISPLDGTNILDQNIINTNEITLDYNQSNFSLSFSALNYVVPGRNHFKYRLVGFDQEWTDNGNSILASYTNIPPGEYTFEVIASNNSGVWNNKGDQLVIKVLPPWYRTKLAYIGYLIFVFVLVLYYRHFIVLQTSLEAKLRLQIIEKENLNKVNKLKTRFFTNISHEFLTPLTLILSPLEAFMNNQDLSKNQDEKLKSVYKNAKRLQRLINQLLDVSKMEADHLALRVSEGDIEEYTHDIYMAFKYLANQKQIALTYEADLQSPICFFDGDKIEKILYNLLSNAIKFTGESGSIKVSLWNRKNHLVLSVKDNGQGIPKDEQSRIFESFYRTKKVADSTIVGTGVGLSLVNGLVKVYGGKIEIESEENKGTTISAYLPYRESEFLKENIFYGATHQESTLDLIDEEIVPIPKKQESRVTQDNMSTIMVVEDNVELNQQLVSLLEGKYNVISAYNGLEAFGKATVLIPELIISDVVMPEMGGIEFLKKIRGNESTSHIPVIMLTAKVAMETRIDSIELGVDAYLTKPFEQKHLDATILNLLKSRQALKETFKKNIRIEPSQLEITSVDEKFITKAIKIVEENISNPDFTVERLGQEIGMSRVQLHRKLTALVGMPTSGFIREIKIKRAAELLTKGQLTVSEVMYEVNIKSRAYFTKSFKEIFGMLPTEYVKSKKA